uniref:Uncharacterized protein n=1 Tax=Pithovirus LCPAC201 TaxID=2506591 RepID=A0A481Z6H9_9VIRU|nr:MAG: hypothetical protein LCPAC201_00300 [Pithovirus LCPAC201]
MSGKRTYLLTPYYQIKSDITLGTCGRYPERNYTSYSLFALKTRLEPLARKRLKTPVLIHFDQVDLNQRLKVTVEFYTMGEPISLSDHHQKYLQEALDYITGHEPGLSLLISKGSKWVVNDITLTSRQQTVIPKWWVNEVSKFLSMASRLRPHYRPKNEYQTAGIYVDLSQFDSHNSFFKNIYLNSVEQLNSMYTLGYMSLPRGFELDRLKKWKMKSLKLIPDSDSLKRTIFYPDWKDQRLTNPVGGLVSFLDKHVVHHSDQVLLEIGQDLLIRHQVAITFKMLIPSDKYIFRGKFVQVEAANLNEAQTAASLVDISKNIPVGKVITFQFSSRGRLNLYLTVLNNLTDQDKKEIGLIGLEIQGYRIDDPQTPYCLSCQIPYSANSFYYQGLIRDWVRNQTTQASQLEKFLPKVLPIEKEFKEPKIKDSLVGIPKSIFDNLPKVTVPRRDGKAFVRGGSTVVDFPRPISTFLGEQPIKTKGMISVKFPTPLFGSVMDSKNPGFSSRGSKGISEISPQQPIKLPEIVIPTSPTPTNIISPVYKKGTSQKAIPVMNSSEIIIPPSPSSSPRFNLKSSFPRMNSETSLLGNLKPISIAI